MLHNFNFEFIARAGYAARGIVFLLVAGLALVSGVAGGKADTKSAVSTLLQQPFGRIWVGLIGFGLFAFMAWRLAQSLADSDGHGRDRKAVVVRLALLGSAVTYFSLASYSMSHAISGVGGGDQGGEKDLARWIMSQPFGAYVAIITGLGFVTGGIVTAAKGMSRKFERYLQLPDSRGILSFVCIYGLVARGIVFVIIGVLFGYAGFTVDPQQAGSTSEALQAIRQLPFGAALYVVLACGLAAFGIYNLVQARYRKVGRLT